MSSLVNIGDILVIPGPSNTSKTDQNTISVQWAQSFQQRQATYYVIIATNKTKNNAQVPFYIQGGWYNDDKLSETSGVKKADEGDSYEITIGDQYQYGKIKKNKFVVWHDEDWKPFANRFVDIQFFASRSAVAVNVATILFGQEFGQKVQGGAGFGDLMQVIEAVPREHLKPFEP
ncbi:hypothetical protein FRB90_003214 [Tulasnella sp. 427]|nr:hypothetical protein FRB90_003214 [Tulasnella sp. 427]